MAARGTSVDKSKEEESSCKRLVVAAIDFGTTFSGLAFSFSSDPQTIYTLKWKGASILADKAPTCVLLSPEKEVVAFGYDAEEKYSEILADDRELSVENAKNHYYFERFKMTLYKTKELNRNTMLADIQGKEMLALDVFAKVIGYLKSQLENELSKSTAGLQDDEILWMLTVPAIWSDSAKQFMKEAAVQAGISENFIRLVLEPEAGSLYCLTKHIFKTVKIDGSTEFEVLPEGQKYIVADLGGGTADLSVHEILANRNIREIYRSDGGAFGGTMLDEAFLFFMEDIFGKEIIQYMVEHHYENFVEMMHEFEIKKRKFNLKSPQIMRIKIPVVQLAEAAETLNEESPANKVKRAKECNNDKLSLRDDKLCMDPETFARFFKDAAEGIVTLIENMRKEDEVGEINVLLMVGGLSESEYIQDVIRQKIPGLRIIVPPDPVLAVLKGAILSGQNPKRITERIARHTYGFSFSKKFEPGTHPEELKVRHNDEDYCRSIFDKMITKGDVLKVGDTFGAVARHSTGDIIETILPIFIQLFRSDDKDPKYTAKGYGCELAGLMVLFPPPKGWPKMSAIVQYLVVGESELTVRGLDLVSGRQVEGKIDFLSNDSSKSANSNQSSKKIEITISFGANPVVKTENPTSDI